MDSRYSSFSSRCSRDRTNVWAVLLVLMAIGLYHDGKDAAALAITTGAFAMLQAGKGAIADK